jgi:hypothetical protein
VYDAQKEANRWGTNFCLLIRSVLDRLKHVINADVFTALAKGVAYNDPLAVLVKLECRWYGQRLTKSRH